MENELKNLISSNETILYEGKPNKSCFIFESIFNPLLPFAIIWAVIDLGFMSQAFFFGNAIMLPFMIFHMMPVWIYLAGVIFSIRRYHNTYYIITDHAVYISNGTFTKNIHCKPFTELSHVNLHRGIFDQMFHVGDVQLTTNQITTTRIARNNRAQMAQADIIGINDISDYTEVYKLVKKLQKDIYSDTMFPNDLRPEENHGYRTKYRG